MRGELFPEREDELQDLIENTCIDTDHINENISDDIKILQVHYTLLLEYLDDLEIRLRKERYQKQKLKNEIQFLKTHNRNSSDEDEITIKQLKCSNASLKSVIVRKDKEIEQIRLLLSESLKEIGELRKFKNEVIKMLNKNGG